jgi:hypothetical protein
LYSLLAISLLFCCQSHAGWVQQAPRSDSEAGYLVTGVSFDRMQSMLEGKSTRARVLSKTHDLYEVFDLTAEQIHARFPDAVIEKNVVFDHMIPVPALDQTPTFNIQDCKRSTIKPTPVITPLEKVAEFSNPMNTPTFDLSSSKTAFSATQSTDSDGKTTTGLEYLWMIFGPHGSKWQKLETGGTRLDLTPDQPGGYNVYLIVRNNVGVCAYQQVAFGVTWNQPFAGSVAPRAFNSQDRLMFKHLATINAEDAWKVTRGEGAVVAVLDSGVNYNHPDLSSNILVNQREVPYNGVDDDGDGYVDDLVGWDFTNGDAYPLDDNSHGTRRDRHRLQCARCPHDDIRRIAGSAQGRQCVPSASGNHSRGLPPCHAAARAAVRDAGNDRMSRALSTLVLHMGAGRQWASGRPRSFRLAHDSMRCVCVYGARTTQCCFIQSSRLATLRARWAPRNVKLCDQLVCSASLNTVCFLCDVPELL